MTKTDKDLIVIHENTFLFKGIEINYSVLKNKAILIAYSSILKILKIKSNEMIDIKPIGYWNSKKKWNNGVYLNEIPKILSSIISDAQSNSLVLKAKELLNEFPYMSLNLVTDLQKSHFNEIKE